MTIGIDASRANKDNKTGTEWYSYHIIQELKKIAPDYLKFVLYTNEKLRGDLSVMPNSNWQEKNINWPPKYLWTQIRLWWELTTNPPDVLFVPAHTIPFLPISKKIKVITVVHDVGFKRFPKIYKPIQVLYHDLTMRAIKKRADLILTISEFSKKEIIELYKIKPEKIKVSYLSYDKETYNLKVKEESVGESLAKFKIKKPYLLYLGRVEKKKNILNMAKAFALAKKNFPELQLVFAGLAGNGYEELLSILDEQNIKSDVILTGYISEKDAAILTANAKIFLFPTLYEGFGIPILQAMACGIPVLISDMDVHREIADGAAITVDPYSSKDIAKKISSVLNDSELRKNFIEKGLVRVQYFSWKKTAEDILNIF